MSHQPPPSVPPPRRNPFVTVLLILTGVILLLPGLCALLVASGMFIQEPTKTIGVWLGSLLVSLAGIGLIVAAIRHKPR